MFDEEVEDHNTFDFIQFEKKMSDIGKGISSK